MPTYGLQIDKELHDKYMKLTHVYGESPYLVADEMRVKLKEIIEELWTKHKSKNAETKPNLIRDLSFGENSEEPSGEGDGIPQPLGYAGDEDE